MRRHIFTIRRRIFMNLQQIISSCSRNYYLIVCPTRRQPQSCFGKNQLLRNSISFSLLTTRHPRGLHDSRVRTSLRLSSKFILHMVSSSRFGSFLFSLYFALLRLGFPMLAGHNPLNTKIKKLVGSFCKKHAVTATSRYARCEIFPAPRDNLQFPIFNQFLNSLIFKTIDSDYGT